MFKSKSLQVQLLLAFSFTALFLVGVSAATAYFVRRNMAFYGSILADNVPSMEAVTGMQLAQKDILISIEDLTGTESTPKQAAEAKVAVTKALEEFAVFEKAYEALPSDPGDGEIWKAFLSEQWKPFKEMSLKMIDFSSHSKKSEFKARDQISKKYYEPARIRIQDFLGHLKQMQLKSMADGASLASDSMNQLYRIMGALVALGFGLSISTGLLFSRKLSRTLGRLANKMSSGANEIADASAQIFGSSTNLSSSSVQQAAALQETASSVDQISAMVTKNADNAKRSLETSERGHRSALKGKEAVEAMITSIDEISKSNGEIMSHIENSNREVSDIVKVISDIGNKTKVINEIVFQTKLLSFNASVEAARAGEHGKGFAVVAEEVGNLAQMSGNAAKEISQMLEGSISKVEGIVNATKGSVERLIIQGKSKVDAGIQTAKRCSTVLDELVEGVSEVNQMVNEITTASQEQAQGIHEITKAMSQLDQVTQQNATSAQGSAGSSERLAGQAGELRAIVKELMATIYGETDEISSDQRVSPSVPKNVIPMKARAQRVVHKSVGAEQQVPASDDPRFEEV